MTSLLESRLEFLQRDAETVASEVEAEVSRLKSACALAIKRLRQHRETLEKVASAPLFHAQAKAVMATLEAEYGFTVDQLRGATRTARLAEARQVGIWLLVRSGWTTADAGNAFNRERTNTTHAVSVVEDRRQTEPKFKDRTDELCASLGIQ